MVVWRLIVMTTLLVLDSVGADSVHGPGYVGCYTTLAVANGVNVWQNSLTQDETVTNVDECVDHCVGMNKTLAVISIRICYCSDSLPNISKVIDSYCNVTCDSNPFQICGSNRYYSVYNTMERLQHLQSLCSSLKFCLHVVDGETTLNSSPHNRQNGPIYTPDIQTTMPSSPTVDNHSYTFTSEIVAETTAEKIQDPVKEKDCCRCQSVWLRIVIDVVVILAVLSLVFIIFLTVRHFRNRQRGMFDEWKPPSFRQTGHGDSRSLRAGDDLLNRNHSYRNLSGSMTLDRGLESLDQVMVASGGSAVLQSLDDDRRHGRSRYGLLPAPPKEESVSTANPRAVTLNSRKLTDVPLAVKDSTPGDSEEGYYQDLELLTPPDHGCNQHVPSEPKNRQTHGFNTSQEEYPKDTAVEVKDADLDKPNRKSLLNILSKDSGKPSSQVTAQDEDVSPEDESFGGKSWGSQYGEKRKKETEAANKRKSSDISEDEKFSEDPKSKTLPNDTYALPNKPAIRNKQQKESSNFDASHGMKSGDVKLQDGYSTLSRLFKTCESRSSNTNETDDTASSNEYSALQPDSKDTDYDKLRQQGVTDGPFNRDNNDAVDKPDAVTYASLNDTEYAEVGEVRPEAPLNGDYEMIPCGQKVE